MSLSANLNIAADEDLFGKVISDLQEDIAISSDNAISGILKYVSDYTGFSSDVSLQSGNYIALHFEVPETDDVTITVTVTNPTVLDSDGIVVLRIADKDSQTITVVASKEGYDSVTKVYDLTELVCETE